MSRKQRFLVIAWPEDHSEADMLNSYACDVQDALDMLQVGGARVIVPLPPALHDACEKHISIMKEVFA